jgi:hypothetical protein
MDENGGIVGGGMAMIWTHIQVFQVAIQYLQIYCQYCQAANHICRQLHVHSDGSLIAFSCTMQFLKMILPEE